MFKITVVPSTLENAHRIVDFLSRHHTTDMKYFPKPERLFDKYTFYEAICGGQTVGFTSYSKLSDWLAMTHATCIDPEFRGKA